MSEYLLFQEVEDLNSSITTQPLCLKSEKVERMIQLAPQFGHSVSIIAEPGETITVPDPRNKKENIVTVQQGYLAITLTYKGDASAFYGAL